MKTNILLTAVIASTYILKSGLAVAETTAPVATKTAETKKFDVEVKPLPMVLGAALGGGGLGLEGEALITQHISVVAGINAMNLHLTDKQIKDMQDNKNNDNNNDSNKKSSTLPQSMNVFSAGLGARYYGSPEKSTWFTGAMLTGGNEHSTWVRDDQHLDVKTTSYSVGLEGGYRWLWDSGVSVRLGGGLGLAKITKRDLSLQNDTASADLTKDTEDRYPTNKPTVVPVLDVGVGYNF